MDVRVHLDYGGVIYDRGEVDKVSRDGILLPVGISSTQLRNVESLQYEAATIVTGAWKSTRQDLCGTGVGITAGTQINEEIKSHLRDKEHQISKLSTPDFRKAIYSSTDQFGSLQGNTWGHS